MNELSQLHINVLLDIRADRAIVGPMISLDSDEAKRVIAARAELEVAGYTQSYKLTEAGRTALTALGYIDRNPEILKNKKKRKF